MRFFTWHGADFMQAVMSTDGNTSWPDLFHIAGIGSSLLFWLTIIGLLVWYIRRLRVQTSLVEDVLLEHLVLSEIDNPQSVQGDWLLVSKTRASIHAKQGGLAIRSHWGNWIKTG